MLPGDVSPAERCRVGCGAARDCDIAGLVLGQTLHDAGCHGAGAEYEDVFVADVGDAKCECYDRRRAAAE
jgi:hypothetical protein